MTLRSKFISDSRRRQTSRCHVASLLPRCLKFAVQLQPREGCSAVSEIQQRFSIFLILQITYKVCIQLFSCVNSWTSSLFIFRKELADNFFAIQKSASGMIKNKYGDYIKYTAKFAISAIYFVFWHKILDYLQGLDILIVYFCTLCEQCNNHFSKIQYNCVVNRNNPESQVPNIFVGQTAIQKTSTSALRYFSNNSILMSLMIVNVFENVTSLYMTPLFRAKTNTVFVW